MFSYRVVDSHHSTARHTTAAIFEAGPALNICYFSRPVERAAAESAVAESAAAESAAVERAAVERAAVESAAVERAAAESAAAESAAVERAAAESAVAESAADSLLRVSRCQTQDPLAGGHTKLRETYSDRGVAAGGRELRVFPFSGVHASLDLSCVGPLGDNSGPCQVIFQRIGPRWSYRPERIVYCSCL